MGKSTGGIGEGRVDQKGKGEVGDCIKIETPAARSSAGVFTVGSEWLMSWLTLADGFRNHLVTHLGVFVDENTECSQHRFADLHASE